MKNLILAIALMISLQATAQSNEYEVNRRNFVSLNTDLNEINLIVHYPGGSPTTEVCGLQLRTNIAAFANSHMEAFIKEIQITDEKGKELTAVQRHAEPPSFSLEALNVMLVNYKLKTKSGQSLRSVIRKTAESEKLNFDEEPEIIVVAKHCKDLS